MKRQNLQIKTKIKRIRRPLTVKILLKIFGELPLLNKFDGNIESIVIFAQEKIGDAILLTPLFKNLKKHIPNVKIHLVAFSPLYTFYELDKNIDVVYRVKQDYLKYFKDIRKMKFDLLYCPKDHPSFTFLWHSRIIKARYKLGIYHENHNGFFNHLLNIDFNRHVIEKNCALLDFLGITYQNEDCRPYLPEQEISPECQIFLSEISSKRLIGLNLSAGEKKREWSLEKLIDFIEKFNKPLIVLSSPERFEDKQYLESKFNFIIKSPMTKSIYEVGQIIKDLELLISPDTSLIHIASCFNTKVVGLYHGEKIHLNRFYPYLIPNKIVVSSTDNIEDIPINDVIDNINNLLNYNS